MVHFILALQHAAGGRILQPSSAGAAGTQGQSVRYILARLLLFLPCNVYTGQVWPVQCR